MSLTSYIVSHVWLINWQHCFALLVLPHISGDISPVRRPDAWLQTDFLGNGAVDDDCHAQHERISRRLPSQRTSGQLAHATADKQQSCYRAPAFDDLLHVQFRSQASVVVENIQSQPRSHDGRRRGGRGRKHADDESCWWRRGGVVWSSDRDADGNVYSQRHLTSRDGRRGRNYLWEAAGRGSSSSRNDRGIKQREEACHQAGSQAGLIPWT